MLGTRWVLTWKHLAACVFFGGLFLYLNYRPVTNSDILLDIQQGRQIMQHGTLGETPGLARSAWLSQVVCAVAEARGGVQYISNVLAVSGLAYLLILARVLFLRTGRMGLTLAGVGIVLLIAVCVHAPTVPEVLGLVCLASLLWLVTAKHGRVDTRSRGRWYLWPTAALLFAAWANLHGSILLGLAILACHLIERMIEIGLHAKRLAAVFSDKTVQRWALLTGLAVVASMYGPRPAIEYAGLFGWCAVAFGMLIAGPLAELAAHTLPSEQSEPVLQEDNAPLSPRSFTVSLMCVLAVWCCFALSPMGNDVLGGSPSSENPPREKAK